MIDDMLAIKVNERAHGEVLRLFHSEVLFVKGMPVTSIYVISKGAILIFSSDGRRVLRWVGPHQLLGINEVLSGGEWRGIGVAHGNVELIAYSHVNLRAVIDKIPEAHKNLLEDLLVPSPSSETKT